jgi:hypothetical protein
MVEFLDKLDYHVQGKQALDINTGLLAVPKNSLTAKNGKLLTMAIIVKLAEKHSIAVELMEQASELIVEYRSTFSTIARLLAKGYSLDQIEDLYKTREYLAIEADEMISLETLSTFCETFFGKEFDPYDLKEKLMLINESMDNRFLDISLKILIEQAHSYNIFELVPLLDYLLGECDHLHVHHLSEY